MKLLLLFAALAALSSGCQIAVSCASDADCWDDEFCDVDAYCSDRRDYVSCFDSSDCLLTTQECFEVRTTATVGAMCTYACSSSGQCRPNLGTAGVCGEGNICYQSCASDTDCENGNRCIELHTVEAELVLACIPGA